MTWAPEPRPDTRQYAISLRSGDHNESFGIAPEA